MNNESEQMIVEERVGKVILKIGQENIVKIGTWRLSVSDIVPQANFIDDLGFDSLDLLDMTEALEEEFDVDISDVETEQFVTVQDVHNHFQN